MEKARGEYVLLLNPDTLLPETTSLKCLSLWIPTPTQVPVA